MFGLLDSRTGDQLQLYLFRFGYAMLTVFMLLPIAVVIGTSFNESGSLVFPPEGISFAWYVEFFADARWLRSFENSLIVATGTMVISTLIGLTAALGIEFRQNRVAKSIVGLGAVPLFIPPIVLGVSLLFYLSFFGLQQTYVGLIIAHSLWATPIVFFVMQSVFSRFDWSLWDAGLDLGASPRRSFRYVMLPSIKTGIVVSALLAFIVSLQEFVMALFISGRGTRTLPVFAWLEMRTNLSPMVSVASTIFVFITIAAIGIAVSASSLNRLADYL